MGFFCGPRQTTAEFLTSITDPTARQVRKGFEGRVPRTPEEFVSRLERERVLQEADG